MVHLRLYMTKLYSVNGGALFLNIGCMIIVSLLEGFGIYMLVPMLAFHRRICRSFRDAISV